MHLEAEHYFILILIQILASHQISPRDWPKCSECCENIISALTNIKAVGHMQKIKHICWRLITQSTHTGQETDHADSTALKWGTWFISYQSRTVMPNTGLNSDLIVQIQQFWLKGAEHDTSNPGQEKSMRWMRICTMHVMYIFQVSYNYILKWSLYVIGCYTSVKSMIKAITSYSGTYATGSAKVQQLPPAAQHILLLCMCMCSPTPPAHSHTQENK